VVACEVAPWSPTTSPPPVLTPLQNRILKKLIGQAMTKDKLAAELKIEASYLHRDGLKHLMKLGKIRNKGGWGYYRPDAPPQGIFS